MMFVCREDKTLVFVNNPTCHEHPETATHIRVEMYLHIPRVFANTRGVLQTKWCVSSPAKYLEHLSIDLFECTPCLSRSVDEMDERCCDLFSLLVLFHSEAATTKSANR